MNGVHDMGGMHGFGPVVPDNAAPWHSDWERRVFVMTLAASGVLHGNIDRRRYELEMLPAADYLRGYFQRWYTRLLNGVSRRESSASRNGRPLSAANAWRLPGTMNRGAPWRCCVGSPPWRPR